MATSQPPLYYFTGIMYNDAFFNTSQVDTITQTYADNKYLARIGTNISSIATDTTFTGTLTATTNVNSIVSKSITSSNISTTATGTVIQASNGTAFINQLSVSSGLTNAINLPNGGINVGTSVTLGGYINLPSTYFTLPSTNQLGGFSQVAFTASQSVTSGIIKGYGSISLPAGGVYIINLQLSILASNAVTLTRFIVEASQNNGSFANNVSQNSSYGSWSLSAANGQVYTTSYTVNTTVPTTIYGNGYYIFSGTLTGTGLISYTRIA